VVILEDGLIIPVQGMRINFSRDRKNMKIHKIDKIGGIILIIVFVGYWGINLGIRATGFIPYNFKSDDMYPTIKKGDRVVLYKKAYRTKLPAKGDVVGLFFESNDKLFVRRIDGIPGGKIIDEGKIIELKNNEYYVTADNKTVLDGKKSEVVHLSNIVGEIILIHSGQEWKVKHGINLK